MAFERLEPCAGKLACTVLRRAVSGNRRGLSDPLPEQTPLTLIRLREICRLSAYGIVGAFVSPA